MRMERVRNSSNLSTMDIVCCGLFAAMIAIGAFIKIMIPVGAFEVTFSLQFFFALLAGILLGERLGFLSVLAYLVIGLVGVPVFAHGGGLGYLLRPTFGFLIGFAAAAYLAGLISGKFSKKGFLPFLLATFVGEMGYYACGLIYYFIMFNFVLTNGQSIGAAELFSVWFLSTVIPDFILCILASRLGMRLYPAFRNRIRIRVSPQNKGA